MLVLDLQGSVELGGVPPSVLSAGGTEVKSEHVNTQVGVQTSSLGSIVWHEW